MQNSQEPFVTQHGQDNSSLPVNQSNGNDCRANIDSTNDGSVQQSSISTITQNIKERVA